MIDPFALVPKWLLAVALALALALAGLQTIRHADEVAAHAESRSAFDGERTKAALALAESERKNRDTERRWARHTQEIADGTQIALDEARKRGSAAVAAGDRLREQISALSACPTGGGGATPATPGASSPAKSTADLLADVRRRLDEAEEATFRFADASHLAGKACERTYDALN